MTQQSECTICFCDYEQNEKKYMCINKDCTKSICKDCLSYLITFSENNNIIPKCPGTNCNGIYTISNICDIPKEYARLYESACFKYLMKDQGDTAKKRIQETKILDDIRNERFMYLQKEYPKAIALIAQITFKSKLRALDKQKSNIINNQMNKTNRRCMNLICNGFLDPNFICMTCETNFCSQCEKKIKDGHVCKQEDLDSINIVNNMIKCPGCKLPVFKNEGCDSITCSNCSINFLYSTGSVGGHGSSNVKLEKTILINKKEKLSNMFEKTINEECLQLLLKLESLEPKIKNKTIILRPLINHFKKKGDKNINEDELNIETGKQISIKIDEYYTASVAYKRFNLYLTKFEEIVLEKQDSDMLILHLKNAIKDLTTTKETPKTPKKIPKEIPKKKKGHSKIKII